MVLLACACKPSMRECSLFFCFLLDVVAAPNTALRVQEASDVLRQRIQVKVCMQTHCWLQQEIAACVQQTPVPPRQCQNCARKHTVPGLCNKHLCHQDRYYARDYDVYHQRIQVKVCMQTHCWLQQENCSVCATNTCATKTVPGLCQETHCARTVQQTPVPPRQCQDCARKHTVPGLCNKNTCATKTVPGLCQETHCARTVQQKHLCHQDSAKTVPGNCTCVQQTPVPPSQILLGLARTVYIHRI